MEPQTFGERQGHFFDRKARACLMILSSSYGMGPRCPPKGSHWAFRREALISTSFREEFSALAPRQWGHHYFCAQAKPTLEVAGIAAAAGLAAPAPWIRNTPPRIRSTPSTRMTLMGLGSSPMTPK